MTIWKQDNPTQADKWYLLINGWDILADNNSDTIVFNNWIFYDANTEWDKDSTF